MNGIDSDMAAIGRIATAIRAAFLRNGVETTAISDTVMRDVAQQAFGAVQAPMLPGDMIVIGAR